MQVCGVGAGFFVGPCACCVGRGCRRAQRRNARRRTAAGRSRRRSACRRATDLDRFKSYRPTPPAAEAQPAPPAESAAPKPAADAAPAPAATADCIDQNGDFATHGKSYSFVFTLTNKCEKRLKCTIDAYITGAKGPSSGHGTLILAPKSHGDAAKKAITMRVKLPGGTAQVSRDCKVL